MQQMRLTSELVPSSPPASSSPAPAESLSRAAAASLVPVPLVFVALPPDEPSPF